MPTTDIQSLQVSTAAVHTGCPIIPWQFSGLLRRPSATRPYISTTWCVRRQSAAGSYYQPYEPTTWGQDTISCSSITAQRQLISPQKYGGIRRIAYGYVWRRLTAKIACNHAWVGSTILLAPRQLGFELPEGWKRQSEHLVAAWRTWTATSCSSKSTSETHSIQCTETWSWRLSPNNCPSYLPFATAMLSGSSHLQLGDLMLQSEWSRANGSTAEPSLLLHGHHRIAEVDKVGISPGVSWQHHTVRGCWKTFWKTSCSWRKMHYASVLRSLIRYQYCLATWYQPDISQLSVVLLVTPLSDGPHLNSLLEVRRDEFMLLSKTPYVSPRLPVFTAQRTMHL